MNKKTDFLIYSTRISSRLKYSLDLMFKNHLGLSYELVTDVNYYINNSAHKINYSNTRISPNEIKIPSAELLFENKIVKIQPVINSEMDYPFFFEETFGDIPFDILSFVFYLVTRYEEYNSTNLDKFGRYVSENSLAVQHQFIQLPLVDLWIHKFAKILKNKFPDLIFKQSSYRYQPTMDVDISWSYLNKGMVRNIGGFFKDLFRLNLPQVSKRISVLAGNIKDPFDQFDFMSDLHKSKNQSLLHFFLVANRGEFDKNISTENADFQNLIKKIARQSPIGLHPSYQSNKAYEVLKKEKEKLESISETKIEKSRQHFLKLQIPKTYRQLIQSGIREDYTMGYPDVIGFRASTSFPFKWFDLEKNEVTDLMIYPFQIMDVTLKKYLQLTPESAIVQSKAIIDQCKKVNGTFMTIWHNSSFDENEGWKDWDKVYAQIVDYAS